MQLSCQLQKYYGIQTINRAVGHGSHVSNDPDAAVRNDHSGAFLDRNGRCRQLGTINLIHITDRDRKPGHGR
jgi:hypothetical protein